MAIPIISSVLDIISGIVRWVNNRADRNNTEQMIRNMVARMTAEQRDKYSEVIDRALKGDEKALLELQALAAE